MSMFAMTKRYRLLNACYLPLKRGASNTGFNHLEVTGANYMLRINIIT